jgi:uncharacterized protein (DUF2267 family)
VTSGSVLTPATAIGQAAAGQPEAPVGRAQARRQGQAISYKEFISVVQRAGAFETAGQAERAALAVLGELAGSISWPVRQNLTPYLPRPARQLISRRSFESSMSRFSHQAFVRAVAEQERVDLERAAHDTRAVLLALDRSLPPFLSDQLHRELASVWGGLISWS